MSSSDEENDNDLSIFGAMIKGAGGTLAYLAKVKNGLRHPREDARTVNEKLFRDHQEMTVDDVMVMIKELEKKRLSGGVKVREKHEIATGLMGLAVLLVWKIEELAGVEASWGGGGCVGVEE